jgi:hypothetical protein
MKQNLLRSYGEYILANGEHFQASPVMKVSDLHSTMMLQSYSASAWPGTVTTNAVFTHSRKAEAQHYHQERLVHKLKYLY